MTSHYSFVHSSQPVQVDFYEMNFSTVAISNLIIIIIILLQIKDVDLVDDKTAKTKDNDGLTADNE